MLDIAIEALNRHQCISVLETTGISIVMHSQKLTKQSQINIQGKRVCLQHIFHHYSHFTWDFPKNICHGRPTFNCVY